MQATLVLPCLGKLNPTWFSARGFVPVLQQDHGTSHGIPAVPRANTQPLKPGGSSALPQHPRMLLRAPDTGKGAGSNPEWDLKGVSLLG